MMGSFANMSEFAQLMSGAVMAFYAFMSAMALLCGFLGAFWPFAAKAAKLFGAVGASTQHLGSWMASICTPTRKQ